MIEAIKNHLEKYHMEPDFTAITGDIAFSGKDYDQAATFFKWLNTVLPVKNKFLPIPGNHDVDRTVISEFFSLHQIVRDKNVDAFLEKKAEIHNHINPKFKAFRQFADTLNPGLYMEQEYFWV